MTDQELKEVLKAEHRLYLERQEELRLEFEKKKQDILNAHANEVHRFNVGDIVLSGDRYVKITRFYGSYSNFLKEPFYVTYHGIELTKKLQPRKDGFELDIYDDGREITKIEQK